VAIEPANIAVDADGQCVDRRYGDVYASRDGAAAQARAVFLAGSGLPERWAGRPQYTVAELGFGLGHNFRATLETWRADPRRPPRLDYVAFEAHPVDAAWLCRAHHDDAFGTALAARWPPALPGVHLLRYAGGAVRLLLFFGDAAEGLAELDFRADAVYLDGFAPSRNPAMWSPRLFSRLRARVAADARLATWSTARPVRDALNASGFECATAPGFGRKRERLVAWPRGRAPAKASTSEIASTATGTVAIIGAGVAGLSAAEALAAEGWRVRLHDPAPMAGASATPVALVHPQSGAADDIDVALRRHALLTARTALPVQVRRDLPVFLRGARASTDTPPGWMDAAPAPCTDSAEAESANGAVSEWGFVVDTARYADWARYRHVLDRRAIVGLSFDGLHWRLSGMDGEVGEADVVVLATGAGPLPSLTDGSGRRAALASLLTPVRGQVEHVTLDAEHGLARAMTGAGYVVPVDARTVVIGASFRPNDTRIDASPEERAANLDGARTGHGLAIDVATADIRSHVGVRAVAADRRPLVGALADPFTPSFRRDGWPHPLPGLYASLGHGARGFQTAFLAADLLAAQLSGRVPALPRTLLAAIDPRRHQRR
jgi:tRNA 5-methylaminomethyl-2-thiouridine biosynthesis bifunctional protein